MSARTLLAAGGALAVGVATVLVPAAPALAAASVTLTVAPTHGKPGAALTATVTVTGCVSPIVTVTGRYFSVDGSDTKRVSTRPVTATPSGAGRFTASLRVPADAVRTSYSDAKVDERATATCLVAGVRKATTSPVAGVTVDDLPAPTVTVTPTRLRRGATLRFAVTGCVGGPDDVYFLDSRDGDFNVPDAGVTFSADGSRFRGSFTIPNKVALGVGSLVVECLQAASSETDVTILPAAAPSASPSRTPSPRPSASPSASPTATRTASPTATRTASPTATRTARPTATRTARPTATATASPEPTGAAGPATPVVGTPTFTG